MTKTACSERAGANDKTGKVRLCGSGCGSSCVDLGYCTMCRSLTGVVILEVNLRRCPLLSHVSHTHHISTHVASPTRCRHTTPSPTAFIMPGSESHDEGHKAKLFGQQGGLLEAAQRFWQKSYAGDYLGLAVLFAAYSVIQLSTEPFHQMFTLSDTRIQHPHAEVERVPVCR